MLLVRLLCLAVLLLMGLPASSVPVGFQLTVETENEVGGSMGSATLQDLIDAGLIGESSNSEEQTESVFLTGVAAGARGGWTVDQWDSTVKEDPFITNNFVVTNNTGGALTYTISVSSPIPLFNANQIVQSTLQVSVLDDDSTGGATLTSAAPTSIYQGQVNGTNELTLLNDPFTLSCTDPLDCTVNGSAAAGVASLAFGPVAATNIGLIIKFTLSDGDSASVLSRFEIVPEPGTGLLLAMGLCSLAIARRRRS